MTNKPSTLFVCAVIKAPQIALAAILLVLVGCTSTVHDWYDEPVSFWGDRMFMPSKQAPFKDFDATCLQKWQGDVKQRNVSGMYPFVLYVEKRDGHKFSGKICYLHNVSPPHLTLNPLLVLKRIRAQKEWSVIRVEGEVYEEVSSHPDES